MNKKNIISELKDTILKDFSIIEVDDNNGKVKIIFSERYLKNNKQVQNNLSFDINDFNNTILENQGRLMM